MKADARTEATVIERLNTLFDAFARRDMEAFLAHFAADPDVVFIGWGADERRLGRAEIRAQVERDWAQTEAASFEYTWTSIAGAHGVAWVAADTPAQATSGGQVVHFPGRLTAVLEQRGEQWLFVQAHFSLPASGQAEGESWPEQGT